MSRIIYLISILDKISNFALLFLILSIGVLFIGGWFYLDTTEMLSDSEEKSVKGFLKVAGIFFVVSTLATVLIPAKEEMYMMALTKDYEVEDVYRMTKDEIKGSIDYVFDKIEELKNE
ncbi:hypothetical protein K8P03_10990 [Anaerococcus murdochii]|uniref:Uncharacterized protein n=1 Tax=Anaerococcus murdochii TaxID=411577 RepID=A0ABS7T1Z2_9FIRM|nr:hypothetical protein [Anaerococcus murdochii]MBZ2387797.1 hypothetical protein [Anaerococcus murdochii]